ncbi:MAG: 3-oxoacyl-ACP synthase [Vicingaceae bacterium]|nr:3-oxoacyl-ACP synthase [Vicingaceae bacterium]
MTNYITSYCHILSDECWVNGKKIALQDSDDDITKQLYNYLEMDYPKFFKMDRLSKTAFLGAELIKNNNLALLNYKDDEVGLLFSNPISSAETDLNFLKSYQNGGMPSPALFVYTLPNILLGEIAIRNKWYGESVFTVSENFDAAYFLSYCNMLLNKCQEAVLCGWIKNNETFLFLVEKEDVNQLNLQLSLEQLNKIYLKKIK